MISPAAALARVLRALVVGAGLGVFYGFLRPLRPKFTTLADLAFSLAFGWGWLYLGFGICGGDLRIGYLAVLVIGCAASDCLLGRGLGPIFSGFWHILAKILTKLLLPGKKIFIFSKKLVASAKKWGKIKWNKRRHFRRVSGGDPHGKN